MYERLEDDPQQSEIVLRRMARFFGTGGLCDRYERRGDHLVQFDDIADLVTDTVPTISREAVVRRFLFSAKVDWFGRHGPRQTIEQLIDLDCSFAPRGRYSLRPTYIRVEASPELVRAPRSVWARWLKAQGWPVPPELETVARGRAGDRPPAGYDPVWISFDEGVRRVMRAAACDQCEAIKGVVAACRDGKVASRYGNTHEPMSWVRASIVTGYRAEVHGYVLVAIVPRANEIFAAPREMLGPTSPDDGVPRVDRAWSYPPIELCREDIERLWPSEGVIALSTDRPPDWSFWRHVPNVTPPEGVALSLNIEPRRLRPNPNSWMAGKALFREGPEFEKRLLLAQRCLGDTLPTIDSVASHYLGDDPVVRLRDFAAWARSIEWEIPPELTNLGGDLAERPTSAVNPDPNEPLTLPEQVRLLGCFMPEDRARARIEKAFRFRQIAYQPEFAVSYEDARIDWQTGLVVLRNRQSFTPTLSAAEFDLHFMPVRATAPKSAIDPEEPTTERTIPPSGIRTTTDEKVETACGDWIGKLTERPHDKETAFEAAISAVAYIGVLSRKAFDRQWASKAPAEWKQAGRRKRSPGRSTPT